MKQLLLLSFLLITSNLMAQRFVSEGNLWITEYRSFFPVFVGENSMYQFRDSTEVDGQMYHILYKADGPDFDDFQMSGLFREEGNVVYGAEQDEIYYSCNGQVGDTISLLRETFEILEIDMMEMNNGSQRKTTLLKSTDFSFSFSFVEGIGTIESPFTVFPPFDVSFGTICFYDEGELIFARQDQIDYCSQFVTTSTTEIEVKKNQYTIVNNGNYLKVISKANTDLRLKIFSITGQLLQDSESNQNQFEVTNLNSGSPGIKICQLFDGAEMVHVQNMFLE